MSSLLISSELDEDGARIDAQLLETKRRLEEREQQFRSIFEYHPDAVFAFDRTGRVVMANQACTQLSGYSVEEILAEPRSYGLPEEFEREEAYFQSALAGQAQRFESVVLHKDGHHVHVLAIQIPIVVDGEVTGVFGIARNVTELNHAVEELKASEQRFRTLAENLPDVVCRIDRDLRFHYINSAVERLTGTPTATLVGRRPSETILSEPQASIMEAALRHVLRTGQLQILKLDIQTVFGRRTFELRMAPEIGPDSSVDSVVVAARDITERERADQDRLAVYQQLLTQQSELRERIELLIGSHHRELQHTAALYQLTQRERHILGLIAKGWTNKQIAAELSVSLGTVKNQVTRILTKLDVSDRTQAASQAVRLGLAGTA